LINRNEEVFKDLELDVSKDVEKRPESPTA
jgi:hypothetical protein